MQPMSRSPSPPPSPRVDASTSESKAPPSADESPTMVRHDSSVRRVRSIIDVLPKLVIDVMREAAHGERSVVHQGEVCRIGTHSSNDLVLRAPAVSRFHCKLTRDGSIWRVQDNGSLNGLALDGVRVRDAEFAAEGTIALGDSRLYVRAVDGTDPVSLPDTQSFGALLGSSVA